MTTTGWLRTQGIMMLAVTLIVGVLLGVAVERVRIVREANRPRPFEGFRPNRNPLPPSFDELGLTNEQRTQLTEIFESRRDRTDSLMRTMIPQLRAHMESIRDEIAQILTPEQMDQFDEMEAARGRRGGRRDGFPAGMRRGFGGGRDGKQ